MKYVSPMLISKDVKKLLRNSILNEEKKGLSFAVVEGMGGIGKSMLARAVFDHGEVAGGGFECSGWVVVSSEFNVKETIKQIIFKLQKCEEDEKKMLEKLQKLEETMKDEQFLIDELEQLLCKQLEGKTYFIVLDDVWEKEQLESLIRAFPNQQGKRSRVLVTSGNKIMTRSRNQYVHEMKLLDADEGWELFLNCAFIDGKCPAELEAIGRQILEKCHGLPLAISVAGRLLVETEAKSGWEEVLAQIESLLGGDESKVSPILELSYQYLPPHLKSCFLFLSFFKEDSIIETTRLVDIWTTHGLIPKQGNEDAIARGHLNELINRSMVQVEALAIDGRVESCRLHDLLREVCIRRAKEEIGLEILKRDDETSSSSSSDIKPRHRVVYGWWNLETSSEEEDQNKHLRSVFLVNASSDSTLLITDISTKKRYWKSFELLKTLDLDGVEFKKFPEIFRSLIGLKSLRIQSRSHPSRFGRNVTHQLPAWFDELKSLEVLDAASETLKFPSVALKMERLRRFHAYYVDGGALNINKWKNIETLKGIRLRDLSSTTASTFRIRELSVYGNGIKEVRKARALMDKMENLEELQLSFELPYLVNSNLIPHHLRSLTKLELHCRMLTCPAATLLPPNLSHLALMKCLVANEDPMPELGKLQKLKYLKLWGTGYSSEKYWKIKVFSVSGGGFPCRSSIL